VPGGRPRLAIIGHPDDFRALRRIDALSPFDFESAQTPFGQTRFGLAKFGEATDVLFADRYATDDAGDRIRAEAMLYEIARLGYQQVVSLNGVGSARDDVKPGDFVTPSDFLELPGALSASYYTSVPRGIYLRMHPAFCPELRGLLVRSGASCGVPIRDDVVCGITRPRLETVAEARMYRLLGADILNMRLGAEAVLARELALCFASFALVLDNPEVGANSAAIHFDALKNGLDPLAAEIARAKILTELLTGFASFTAGCACHSALEEPRRKGMLDGTVAEMVFERRGQL